MTPRLAASYFAHYGGVAIQMAFLPSFLLARGLSTGDLGSAQLVYSCLAAVTCLIWGRAADRARHPSQVLRLSTSLAVVLAAGLWLAPTGGWLMEAWATMGVVGLGVIPILDGITVEHTRTSAKWPYGRVRVFGSVGYIVVGQLMGIGLSWRGDQAGDVVVVLGVIACFAVSASMAWTLSAEPRSRPEGRGGWRGIWGDRRLQLLFAVAALHWAANGVYHVFFGPFLRERGGASWMIASALMVGVVAEILVFWAAAHLHARFSIQQALAASFVVGAVRWTLTPLMPHLGLIIALQALHGITFGLFWVTVQRALSEWVPARMRARGQAAFAAVVFGLAHGLGSFVFGHIEQATGSYTPVFLTAVGFELLATGLLISRKLAMTTPAL